MSDKDKKQVNNDKNLSDEKLKDVSGGYGYGQDEDIGNGDYMPIPSKPTTPPNAQ